MPEIIDLEVAKDNMLKKVKGKKATRVNFPVKKVLLNCESRDVEDSIVGAKLDGISRESKILVFDFGGAFLASHLMLHGNYCWKKDGQEKNIVFELEFETGDCIVIKDWSGWTKIELQDDSKNIVSEMLNKDYGLDPMSDKFDLATLKEILERKSRSGVKGVLMDQQVISGIGNAYADEILWDSKINPITKCSSIIKAQNDGVLFDSMQSVLQDSLEIVRDLSAGESLEEQDRGFMKVYRKSGQKCPRCGYMIACIKVNSRDTFVCEKCQPKN